MPTYEEALEHLGIDYADDVIQRKVNKGLKTAERYLFGAVGVDIWELLPGDERAHDLVLNYLDDIYSERGTSAKAGNARREMISTMEWQLKLELARKREEAEEVD